MKNPAGNATPNNPASYEINWIDQSDLNNMSPVSLINPTSYSVTITPEYGSAVTYYQPGQKPVVPDNPAAALGMYNDAKTAFDTAKANGTLDADKNALLADLDAAMAALKALKNLEAEDQAKVDAAIADIEAMEKELGKEPTTDEPGTGIVTDGKATVTLPENTAAGDKVNIVLKGADDAALTDDAWYRITGGSIKSGAKQGLDNALSFSYEADGSEDGTVTFDVEKFVPDGPAEPTTYVFVMAIIDGQFAQEIIPILPDAIGLGRAATAPPMSPTEVGSVWTLKVGTEVEVPGVLTEKDNGRTYVVFPMDLDKAQEILDAIHAVEPGPSGTRGAELDMDETTITGDAFISEDGSEINLNLGQPKVTGAKLPTTLTIDNTVAVEVTWFVDGVEVTPDENGNVFADAEGEYTYQVKTSVVENPEITLADDITITKGEGDDKATIGTVTKSDIEEGTTVTPSEDDIVTPEVPAEGKVFVNVTADAGVKSVYINDKPVVAGTPFEADQNSTLTMYVTAADRSKKVMVGGAEAGTANEATGIVAYTIETATEDVNIVITTEDVASHTLTLTGALLAGDGSHATGVTSIKILNTNVNATKYEDETLTELVDKSNVNNKWILTVPAVYEGETVVITAGDILSASKTIEIVVGAEKVSVKGTDDSSTDSLKFTMPKGDVTLHCETKDNITDGAGNGGSVYSVTLEGGVVITYTLDGKTVEMSASGTIPTGATNVKVKSTGEGKYVINGDVYNASEKLDADNPVTLSGDIKLYSANKVTLSAGISAAGKKSDDSAFTIAANGNGYVAIGTKLTLSSSYTGYLVNATVGANAADSKNVYTVGTLTADADALTISGGYKLTMGEGVTATSGSY